MKDITSDVERAWDTLRCCICNCGEPLLPRRKDFGGQPCPKHHITLGPLNSSRRTYVYDRAHVQENFVIATDILQRVATGKRESHRLGNENSEDALSWNVFVGLLAIDGLTDVFELLSGTRAQSTIELYMWGWRVDTNVPVARWERLQHCQEELELKQWLKTRVGRKPGCTEPDIILRDPGNALVVVVAKLSSPNSYLPVHRIGEYLQRY